MTPTEPEESEIVVFTRLRDNHHLDAAHLWSALGNLAMDVSLCRRIVQNIQCSYADEWRKCYKISLAALGADLSAEALTFGEQERLAGKTPEAAAAQYWTAQQTQEDTHA